MFAIALSILIAAGKGVVIIVAGAICVAAFLGYITCWELLSDELEDSKRFQGIRHKNLKKAVGITLLVFSPIALLGNSVHKTGMSLLDDAKDACRSFV